MSRMGAMATEEIKEFNGNIQIDGISFEDHSWNVSTL